MTSEKAIFSIASELHEELGLESSAIDFIATGFLLVLCVFHAVLAEYSNPHLPFI